MNLHAVLFTEVNVWNVRAEMKIEGIVLSIRRRKEKKERYWEERGINDYWIGSGIR